MILKDLLESIKQRRLNSVYLVLGKQDFLKRRIKQHFLSLIPTSQRTMNLSEYDLQQDSLGAVLNDVVSLPFLGRYRLIFVNNPFFLTGKHLLPNVSKDDIGRFIRYLKHPILSTILVVFAPYRKLDGRKKITKELMQSAKLINLNYLTENAVREDVKRRIQKSGYQMDSHTMDLLVQRTGNHLSIIMNELPKLFLYCDRSKKITKQAVKDLVTKSLDQNVFDLIKVALSYQTTQAISLYHDLLIAGRSPLQINTILISQFRLLLQVMILKQHGYRKDLIARKLKVHPYRIHLSLLVLPRYTLNQLNSAYLGLVKMEEQLKSTNQSPELLFEMFIIGFYKGKGAD